MCDLAVHNEHVVMNVEGLIAVYIDVPCDIPLCIKTYLRLFCCVPYIRTITTSTRVFINNIQVQVSRKSIVLK